MFAQKELSVDEFRLLTGKSINQISLLTGADPDTVKNHRRKGYDPKPQYVQFRRHLGLLAQSEGKI
jgi:hypothetical protein